MRKSLFDHVSLATLAFAWAIPASAQAQSAASAETASAQPDRSLDDIVVTARREAESLLSVPVQVSVATGEQLSRTNANDLPKIAETIPFVTIGKQTSGNGGGYVIRGVGNFSGDVGVKQTVLLNLDNVFVGRAKIINQGMYDIAQVEVLKGPQALFYGKNSPAGVVSIISKDPGHELEGYVRASYEFEADERVLEGAVSIPVWDDFSIRVAGRAAGVKGWLRNNAEGYAVNPLYAANPARFGHLANVPVPAPGTRRSPESDEQEARITLLWQPQSNFTAKLKYAYGLSHGNGDGNTTELTCRPGVTAITTAGIVDPQNDCKGNRRVATGAFPPAMTVGMPYANGGQPFADTETHLASLNIDYTGNNFSVSSITGYYKLKYRGAQNSFFDSLGSLWNPQTEDSSGFSQELRLTTDFDMPFNFVLGGFYGRTKQKNQTFANLVVLGLPYDPVAGTYDTYHRLIKQNSTTWSGFGQVRWSIFDALEINAGARYTWEKNTDYNGNAYLNPLAALPPINYRAAGDFFDREETFTDWSPEATLTWHPTENQTLYAAYKTGFKSGGFSAPPVLSNAFTDADTRFEPETVKGFEVGYKAQLLDRTLNLQLTAYRYDYSNQQVTIFVPSSIGFLVRNAAKSRVQGIEGQVTWRATTGLTLNGAVGYNDAHYVRYEGAACWAGQTAAEGCVPYNGSTAQDFSGRTLPRSPKWAGNFGAVYEGSLTDDYNITLSGSGIYSSAFLAQDNLDPYMRQGAYWKFNASVAVSTLDDKFELALIGRNLTDKYTIVNSQDKGFGSPGNYAPTFTRPREITLQATVRF